MVVPPIQEVQGTTVVVTNGAVGTGVEAVVIIMMMGVELVEEALDVDWAPTGVLGDELVRLIKGAVVEGVVAGTTVVTAVVVIVVFIL